jgi:tetratricopeptide (TPR) repeat protein
VGFFNSVANLFTKEKITGDVVPGATGEYGFEASNPIPTAGVSESDRYLSMLRTSDGKPVSAERFGCGGSPAVPGRLCDSYFLKDGNGENLGKLYLCPYFTRTSETPPRGFMLQAAIGRGAPAGASLEDSFKHMALDAFPGGHNQVLRESHELRALLDRALSVDECTNVVTKIKALFLISQDRSFERMIESINVRAGGKLSMEQTRAVYDFLNDKFEIVRPFSSKKEKDNSFMEFKQHLADGTTAFRERRFPEAISSIRKSLRHIEIANEDGIAQMLSMIAMFAETAGDKEAALNYHRRATGVYFFDPSKPNDRVCKSLAASGRRQLEVGNFQDAEEYFVEALAIADKLGIRVSTGAVMALYDLSWLYGNVKGNAAEAGRLKAEADSIKAKLSQGK